MAIAVGAAGLLGINQVASAQSGSNQYTGLIQKIAQTFNLDQNKVQAVFDQYRQEQQASLQQKRQQQIEDRLSQAVQQGKLTNEQKQAILDELAALKSKYNPDSLKNMTPDQRKQAFQNEQAEIKSWTQSHGIDVSYLMRGFGMGRHDGWFNKSQK